MMHKRLLATALFAASAFSQIVPVTDKMLFDARGAQWASPYAFVTMLAAGQAIADAKGPKPIFTAPDGVTKRSATTLN